MVNKVVLQGRLVAAPELRSTQSGKSVASFTIAWSEKYGEQEQQLFLPCIAWGKTGEMASRYFTKGQEAAVDGKLVTRKWKDQNGNNRSTTELIVDRMHFCGPKRDGESSNTYNGYQPAGPGVPVGFSDIGDNEEPGELPF